ncbi:hypothetical protein PR048_002134, partial [Dryococelus australis]
MLHGQEAVRPINVPFRKFPTMSVDWETQLQNDREQAEINLLHNQQAQKLYFDKKHNKNSFQVGQYVWVKNHARHKSLEYKFKGPYLIEQNCRAFYAVEDMMSASQAVLFVLSECAVQVSQSGTKFLTHAGIYWTLLTTALRYGYSFPLVYTVPLSTPMLPDSLEISTNKAY